MSDTSASTINIPQLLVLLVLSFLALRWYQSSRSGRSNGDAQQQQQQQQQQQDRRGRTVSPATVEQVAQMFPQLTRRAIAWDLQRNGGSVQATTERVLAGRRLETPPPSFQPTLPAAPSSPPNGAPASASPAPAPPTSQHPDLITRYKLHDKIRRPPSADESDEGTATNSTTVATPSQRHGWSQSKAERQALLQRRREEMILAARRKMEEKDREKAKGSGT